MIQTPGPVWMLALLVLPCQTACVDDDGVESEHVEATAALDVGMRDVRRDAGLMRPVRVPRRPITEADVDLSDVEFPDAGADADTPDTAADTPDADADTPDADADFDTPPDAGADVESDAPPDADADADATDVPDVPEPMCEEWQAFVEGWGCARVVADCPLYPGTVCQDHEFADVDFLGADLHGADFSRSSFTRVRLDGVDFTGATLVDVNASTISAVGATFVGVRAAGLRFDYWGRSSDLRDADFTEADLTRAEFGNALEPFDLTGAVFVRATMPGASFSQLETGGSDLSNVDFTDADMRRVSLGGSTPPGAVFARALLEDAIICQGEPYRHVHLEGVDFTGAHARRARMAYCDVSGSLDDVDFTDADLVAVDFTAATLIGTVLDRAVLSYGGLDNDIDPVRLGGLDLRETSWTGTELYGVDLTAADLRGVDLSTVWFDASHNEFIQVRVTLAQAQLQGASFAGNTLRAVDLSRALLQGADLSDAVLASYAWWYDFGDIRLAATGLVGADLTGADLTRAQLIGVNLTSANLTEAGLRGIDVQTVVFDFEILDPVRFPTSLSGATLDRADLSCASIAPDTNLAVASSQSAVCPDEVVADDCRPHLVPAPECEP